MVFQIEEGPYELVITKLGKCKGESMASNRKNRLITYWDYELEINFKVCRKDKETEGFVNRLKKPKNCIILL